MASKPSAAQLEILDHEIHLKASGVATRDVAASDVKLARQRALAARIQQDRRLDRLRELRKQGMSLAAALDLIDSEEKGTP